MSMPAELVDNSVTVEKLLDGLAPAPAIGITGIAADSRKVRPGYLFLACQGATSHGLDFVAQAESAGAAAIAWDASRYPAGLYFIRLETAGQVFTQKVILAK